MKKTNKPNGMVCTQCGKDGLKRAFGERFNAKIGHIICKDELLCLDCATKRKGFKTLNDINNGRKA